MTFSLLGITFHWYGLIAGSAVVIGLELIEKALKLWESHVPKSKAWLTNIIFSYWWSLVGVVIFFGVVGARLWHVATDWFSYVDRWQAVFFVWYGGMSILGALLGGVLGVMMWLAWLWMGKKLKEREQLQATLLTLLDATVFGLPFAQAIGRLGNYVNQELYGLPTTLPWAVTIEPQFRSPEFMEFSTFHPLFAYEALPLFLFGLGMWKLFQKSSYSLGNGRFFFLYILFYSILRFLLDFLRVQKQIVFVGLGKNQLVLGGLILVLLFFFVWEQYSKKRRSYE